MLDDWAHASTDARDVINATRHDDMRADFNARMGEQLAEVPVDQRPAYFQKQLPVLRDALATVPISTRRAEVETQKQAQWERQNYEAVFTQSRKQVFEDGARLGVASYYRKLSSGDIEGAHRGLTELKSVLLLSEQQYQEHIAKGDALLLRRHSEEYLATNPHGMVEDIDESLKTGRPVPGFRWTGDEARSYLGRAQAAVVERTVQTGYSAHQAIVKGEITDEASLRQRAGRDLSEGRIVSLARLIHDDPAYEPSTLTQLRTAVRSFSPASDRDESTYAALQQRIESTVPKAMQPAFADELHKAWQTRGQHDATSATRQQQAGYFRQIDSLTHKGLIGDADHPATAQNAEAMKADIERFMKANPNAPSREVKERLRNLAQDNGLARRAANILRDRSVAFSR